MYNVEVSLFLSGLSRWKELWYENGSFPLWLSILVATLFLIVNAMMSAANWYCERGAIMEYGYPKMKEKTLRKRIAAYSFWEKVFLFRLCREAKHKGFMIYLCLAMNLLNCISFCVCCVGFLGTIITCGHGWALMLLFTPFVTLMLSVAVRFVPDLLFLPSERQRYGIGGRRKK